MTTGSGAHIRVYLFTYRRNHLLPRALKSLVAQTYTNWVCELHNDDPQDPYPEQLLREIADPRIAYVRHERNLGPTANFNHAFRPVAEPFVSLLEDDNWWEPGLLERLLDAIRPHPDINLAWGNSRLWRETADGEWRAEGTIWPVEGEDAVSIFDVPDPLQACRAIHSHGAMVLRVTPETMIPSPLSMPIFAIEPIRERTYPGRLLLVRETLANFAITRETWRRETADENMQIHVLLAMTLMAIAPDSKDFYARMWSACRGARGHKLRALVAAGALSGKLSSVLRGADLTGLAWVAGWAARHPRRFANLFAAPQRFPEVLNFLESAARRNAHR